MAAEQADEGRKGTGIGPDEGGDADGPKHLRRRGGGRPGAAGAAPLGCRNLQVYDGYFKN